MRSRPVTRRMGGILLGVLLLTGGLAPLGAQAGDMASPVPADNGASVLTALAMTPHGQVDP